MTLFNSLSNNTTTNWRIVDDIVMGGKSNGHYIINHLNHVEFYGNVSLENNGGFSMIQYHFETTRTNQFNNFLLKIKGDGKSYQFRVKLNNTDKHSYTTTFKTNNKWETIQIPFNQLQPTFRGKKLNLECYKGEPIEMVAFLIGNKKEEDFKLEIGSIELF